MSKKQTPRIYEDRTTDGTVSADLPSGITVQLYPVSSGSPEILVSLTGEIDDLDASLSGVPAGVVYFTSASDVILTGIAAGTTGRVVWLINATTNIEIALRSEDTSVAANQFKMPGDQDFYLRPGYAQAMVYSTHASRWFPAGAVRGMETEASIAIASDHTLEQPEIMASSIVLIGTPGATFDIKFPLPVSTGQVRLYVVTNLTDTPQNLTLVDGTGGAFILPQKLANDGDSTPSDYSSLYSTMVRVSAAGVFRFPAYTTGS